MGGGIINLNEQYRLDSTGAYYPNTGRVFKIRLIGISFKEKTSHGSISFYAGEGSTSIKFGILSKIVSLYIINTGHTHGSFECGKTYDNISIYISVVSGNVVSICVYEGGNLVSTQKEDILTSKIQAALSACARIAIANNESDTLDSIDNIIVSEVENIGD